MEQKKSVFVHCPQLEQFVYPPQCPFNVSRAGKVRKIIKSKGLLDGPNASEVAPEPAKRVVLKKFHSARYLKALKTTADGKFDSGALAMGIGTPDCPVFEDMYDYSVWACGATLKGIELLLSGQAAAAFNPSGGLHHAGPQRASGFCYLNDVALGCMVLTEAGKKVLYLDVDVHHGDGVAYAFYDRSDVMTISFHQSGRALFPGTGFADEIGKGKGKGYCVNVPFPPGTYDQPYMQAFKAIVPPLVEAYSPDAVVFELGADALAGDPLAHLYLTNSTYVEIIRYLLRLNKPILMTGGGGYNIDNTVRAWSLAWSVLSGDDPDRHVELWDEKLTISSQQRDMVIPQVEATIKAVKKNLFTIHGL